MARRGGCGGLIRPTPALSVIARRRRDKPTAKMLTLPEGARAHEHERLRDK